MDFYAERQQKNFYELQRLSEEMYSLESDDSKIVSVFNEFTGALGEFNKTELQPFTRNVIDKLLGGKKVDVAAKLLRDQNKVYLTVAKSVVSRPTHFTGDLSEVSEKYFKETEEHAYMYDGLLDRYQAHLIETASAGDILKSSHVAMLDRYLKEERKFNLSMSKYFNGGARDAARLGDLLPKETSVLTFSKVIENSSKHPLLRGDFYEALKDKVNLAAVTLEGLSAKDVDPKVLKELARDGFALAEISNTLVGRGYTLIQFENVYVEMIAILKS